LNDGDHFQLLLSLVTGIADRQLCRLFLLDRNAIAARKHKAAVKMHTLLDLHGNIPSFIRITHGKTADVNILDEFLPEAGAFYVMDRGYIDFARLFVFTLCSAFFVVRTKEKVLLQRRYSHSVDKSTGVRSDHTVILTTIES